MKKWLAIILALSALMTTNGYAIALNKPLSTDEAFKFSAYAKNSSTIVATWQIASKHYLYRDRIKFDTSGPHQPKLAPVVLPAGIPHEDEVLGKYQIYKSNLQIPIKLLSKAATINLVATYQGCSADGFCYPPVTKQVQISLRSNFNQVVVGTTLVGIHQLENSAPMPQQEQVVFLLKKGKLWLIIAGFFGFGFLLAFTPCVLPMIPILSGIIIGHADQISTKKAFLLSLTYVLSMSITYAIAGILAGVLGGSLQAMLQNPWVISCFSILFVLLALSLFGLYNLHLPAIFTQRIDAVSRKQKSGSYWGVAIMGCLATLIVSPCITPPLIGALSYISQTGDALLGGCALFVMGLGMGLPLLVIGTSGGKLLPKSGPWMDAVKSIFGVFMLGVAIWMLSRIVPGQIILLLWALLLITCAIFLGAFNPRATDGWHRLWKGVGLVLVIYSIALIIGAAMGNKDPFHPLRFQDIRSKKSNAIKFKRIKTIKDFNHALAKAKKKNKYVMLDFYADWCVACIQMENGAFADLQVKNALKNFILLQADVTANDANDKQLEQSLNVVAPPTIIFFAPNGKELIHYRIVGEQNTNEFLKHIQQLKNSNE